jgi:predicted dehydrogenase
MPLAIAREHAKAGLESRHSTADRFLRGMGAGARHHDVRQRLQGQWERFIRHVVEDAPYTWTLREGAKGVQLVELAHQSWKERRWVDVPELPA